MNLFRYNQFIGKPLNENIQGAKKLIKDRYLMLTAVKDLNLMNADLQLKFKEGEKRSLQLKDFSAEEQEKIKQKIREIRVPDNTLREIERDPAFVKIRELLKDNLGWCYIFTYFYYIENVAFEELESIYNKLLDFKQLLNRLPKPLDNNFIDVNVQNNNEILVDELEKLNRHRKLKRFLDQLPGDMRREFTTTSDMYKEKIESLAVAFDDFGKDAEGKSDESAKNSLQKFFFSKIKRYKTLREIIPQAENYIKGLDNKNIVNFYKLIEKCNEMYGIVGADIVMDESGILILDIKSFQANKMLNSNTSHCIASYEGHWSSYVGTEQDNKFNKQYYIYDFNRPSNDVKSIIGITIEPNQRINACHTKNDGGFVGEIKGFLKECEKKYKIDIDLWSMLAPMSADEIALKKKRIAANRKIVEPKISLEEMQRLVRDEGADVNRETGKPLENAVVENSLEKVKYLLDLGASPNLRQRSEATINKAKSLDMIKLLVNKGAELTSTVFKNIMEDTGAVEYCLKAGMDPNFENKLPIRTCCKMGSLDTLKLLIKYGADMTHNRSMPMAWAAENARKDFMEYMIDRGVTTGFAHVKRWIQHTTRFGDDAKGKAIKADMEKYINDLIKSGRVRE